MQEIPTLTDLRVFYLLVDASVVCVYVCNTAERFFVIQVLRMAEG